MPKYPPLSIKSSSAVGCKYLLRTILNPKNIIENLNQTLNANSFKSLLLLVTKNYCTTSLLKNIFEFQKDKDIQLIFAAVDTIAPYSNRSGILQLWVNRTIQIEDSQTLKDYNKIQLEKFKSNEIIKNGRIISKSLDLNHGKLHNNYFSMHVNFINSKFANRHTGCVVNYDLKFKTANTLFNNNNMQTCFYLLSESQKAVLKKADPKQFPNLRKLLDNNNNLLNNIEISIPPIQFNSKLTLHKYDGLTDIGEKFLKISQIKGNLVFKIDDQPASSILQNNSDLMNLMDKNCRIFAVLKTSTGETRKFEIIAGGGSYGDKSNILAIDPSCIKFLEKVHADGNTDIYIKFYLYKPRNIEDSIQRRKLIFERNSGLYIEKSPEEENFTKACGQERVLENIIGIGSEGNMLLNDCLFSENEVLGFNTNIE